MKSSLDKVSRLGVVGIFALLCSHAAFADSATWQTNPVTGNWNTAANWTPTTVPNGPSDVAAFASSSQTNLSITSSITVASIVFQPDANPFSINTSSQFASVLINGAGVINNSAVGQNFVVGAIGRDQGALDFAGSATAGNAIYSEHGGAARNSFGGTTSFFNTSTAGTATFFLEGGTAKTAAGGGVLFFDAATAGSANIILNPGAVRGAGGGHLEFANAATAGSATILANGGTNGALGGTVFFLDDSKGGTANVVLLGNATLDLSQHSATGVTLSSVQGNGSVVLGSSPLTINTKLTIPFSGIISGAGSLVKIGKGKLDLTNANTYTGGTTLQTGTLLVDNPNGSGTGTGAVQINSGALGGIGTIAGAVTIGSNVSGNGAFLTPGAGIGQPGTLTIQSALTFASDGFFNVSLIRNLALSEVVANGITIQSGAQFAFFNTSGARVRRGTIFILISNTSITPINGTFDNLPDGLVFTDNGNKFLVSYKGGDGNDLTLTSVP